MLGARSPRVVDLAAAATLLEHAGRPPAAAGRAVVMAHHGSRHQVTRSVCAYVDELVAAGFRVVVVSSSELDGPLEWGDTDLTDVTVLRKPNVGYDFGSWAIGLHRFPDLARCDRLVLTNDSLAGPFATIAPLLDRFDASPADVWGFTETLQFTRHAQSFFLGFRGGVLREPALRHFWSDIRHYDDKELVIHRNELGLARLLAQEGFTVDAAYPAPTVVDPADNPTIAGWRTLLDRGWPFVKREIVRSPELAPDGTTIPDELRARFGVDVATWIDT